MRKACCLSNTDVLVATYHKWTLVISEGDADVKNVKAEPTLKNFARLKKILPSCATTTTVS